MGVGKLEDENATLKTAVSDTNREVEQLRKDKENLTAEVEGLRTKTGKIEFHLEQLAVKLVLKLEELCRDFEAETGRVETGLDPINCPMKDEVAMNLLRLESRLDGAVDYLARLKAAMARMDVELWPQEEISQDLESLMTRLNQITDRVQELKKSFARCGADVALSLVRVHCK
ncbi:uncharacterized protein LOC119361101 [Triticum dicoccoides]|uniref:uncharacterized protein LOC119361101 n=1 Tax=Triticum dicoccoides TaxID=85692 RepID=UPI00188FE184|nr:uncharacterized protein LOC119361101 [Triticum dicoccoides]